jgi:hypothetical protein
VAELGTGTYVQAEATQRSPIEVAFEGGRVGTPGNPFSESIPFLRSGEIGDTNDRCKDGPGICPEPRTSSHSG